MKKLLPFFYSSLIIILLSNSYSFGQWCNSSDQTIDSFTSICVNTGSTVTLRGNYGYFNDCDEYGWCDEYWWANPITVKRPDGSVALVIDQYDVIADGWWLFYYDFPAGFFNVVGNWTFSCLSEDYCSGDSHTEEVSLKVVGTYTNSISSNEVICNVGGTPQNIVNVSLSSNSAYTINWQNKTGAGSWNYISGATSASYQPSYINQTTSYRRIITTTELGCVSSPSNEVVKFVYASLTNGAIGSNQDVCFGVSPALITETTAPTGGSSGPNYSYQWYSSTNNTTWNLISGASSKTYQPSFVLGYRYYRRKTIDVSCGETYTNSVQIHGYSDLSPGTIGSDQLICYGAIPSLINVTTVETGGIGSNTYQWYSSANNSTWSVASGSSTGQNYQPPALTSKTYYRKAIINSCKTLYTNTVTKDVRTALSPGSIGNDQTICYNETPAIIATLSNPSGASNSYTYAWVSSINNSTWNTIPGANLVSYQPPALTQKTYYKKRIIDANCNSDYTNTVIVTVRQEFLIGSIGSSQTICNGATPTPLTNATPPSGGQGTYTYIWESSLNTTDWSIITGATSSSYQPGALTATKYYRRKVTDASCGSGYNNTVTINVKPVFSVGAIGSAQTICINRTPAKLTSTSPSGGMGGYTYFWENSLNGTDFNTISGANSETYQPGVLSQTTYYRRHVNDASCGGSYTNTVQITVRNPVTIGTIGSDQIICSNSTPGMLTTTIAPTGGSNSFTYSWESSLDNSNWNIISGANGTSYQPGVLSAKTYFRKSVTDLCASGYTNTVTISIRPDVTIGSIQTDQTICYSEIPSLLTTDVAPSGGTGTFTWLWESSPNNSTWTPVVGATNESYQPLSLTSTMYYRRKVINTCSTGYTNPVVITVRPNLVAGSISSSQTICYNTAPISLVTSSLPVGGTGVFTWQWQSSVNNSTWSNISGATAETYSPGVMTASLYFRRSETSGTCGTVQTNSVHIIVNNQLVAGTVKTDQTICYGESPSIFLTNTYPTGGTGSYTYQWQELIASSWTDISSANSETYTSGPLTSTSYFRRSETSGSCGTVNSNQITVTVHNQFLPGVIGSSQTINYGAVPAELVSVQSASGGEGAFTYQWQGSLDNSTWSSITDAVDESYQPLALTVTKYFKRVTSDGSCGTIETNVLTINVNSLLVPGEIEVSQTICYNTAPYIFITTTFPTGGDGSYLYQWQKTEDGITWDNIIGANINSYQSGVLIKTTYFRKKVTSVSIDDYSNIITVTVADNFIPGEIGADQTVCYSEIPGSLNPVNLPSGGNGSYTNQWKTSLNSSTWTVVTGATDSYYEPPALTAKTYYKKIVTNLCGEQETNIITINVNPDFLPGSIGNDQTILFNTIPQKLDVSTNATGGTGLFTYQWQKSIDNSTWTNITGANEPFYQSAAISQTTYFKRLTTSGSCGTLETNKITITVTTEVLVGTIGIDQTICYLAAPALLTTLTGPSVGVVVNSQNWLKSEDAAEWNDISTATSDTYQSGVLNKTTYFRKKMVTASNGTVYTNIVTITVYPAFAPGTIGSDQAVCKTYASAPITTLILPTGQMIQNIWQISDNNTSWDDITGATNDYYDAGVLAVSKFFRKKVTGSCGTGYTNSVKITVNDELQGGTIGSDQAIAYNTTPSLLTGTLPTGGSGTFTYQWYYSVDNIDWQVVITSGDGKDYQPGVLSQKTYFKRKVTGESCGEKYSNTITVTVFDSLLPGVVSDAQNICYNAAPAILSGTSPDGGTGQYSYQWQYSLQGITWVDIPSEVGISYKPDVLNVNAYYRRAVTSGNSTVYSNFVMIKVFDQVSLPVTDLKTSYCKGSTVNINVVNPSYLSYKWFDSGHAYLMDGTKYTLNSITTDNTVFVKSLNLNGCLSDYQEQKIIVDNVKANFIQDITTVTLGDPIKFTSTSVNASGYTWNFFEGDIINEPNPVHYYNTLGENSKKFGVKLIVSSPGGCVDSLFLDEIITVVNDVTGIEKNKEVTLSYYPNPVNEKLYLIGSVRIKTVKVFNISGKMIESLTFDSEKVTIDFSELRSDIYILEINGLKDSKKSIKIIKK
ncbi:MAG TPA: T9SS type A sorting domain-containing protein [Bacteroidales bacterium]|nr:T9SS type A sorting domain-containing protein [Bacteroidales bacterium]